MKVRVIVTLKEGVLDPQGKAIHGSLDALGFENVNNIRQGKVFDIEIDENDKDNALSSVKHMCKKLLVNEVIENYNIQISEQ